MNSKDMVMAVTLLILMSQSMFLKKMTAQFNPYSRKKTDEMITSGLKQNREIRSINGFNLP